MEVIIAENKHPGLLSFEFKDKFGSRLSICSKNDELRDVNSELSLSIEDNSKTSQKVSVHTTTDTPQSNVSVTLSTIVAMTDTSCSKQESDSSLSSNDMVTTTLLVDSVEDYNNNNNNNLPSGVQQQQQQQDNNSLTESSSMKSSCSIPACSNTIVGGNVNNSNIEDTFTSIPLNDTVEDSQRSGERMKNLNNFNLDEILFNIDTIKTEIIDEDDEVKIYGSSSNSSSSNTSANAVQSVSSGSNVTTNVVVVMNSNEKNLNNEDNICKLFFKKVFCWTG